MRLKLSLRSASEADDVVVTVDSTATVGEVAERLRSAHPRVRSPVASGPTLCLKVNPGAPDERIVGPDVLMGKAGIRSGDNIALTGSSAGSSGAATAAATLRIVSGSDAGRTFALRSGTSLLGRDRSCEVRLTDPLVSKRHAKIIVTDMIEIVDDDSANGVEIDDAYVQRAVVSAGQSVFVGDTEFTVTVHVTEAAGLADDGSTIEFNRSPRLDPRYEGIEFVAPEPPEPPKAGPFPWLTIVAPILMGAVMYAVTKSLLSIMFISLSPVMMVGAFYQGKWTAKTALKEGTEQFRASLKNLAIELQYALEAERTRRRIEHPSVDEVNEGVHALSPLTWTRRPEHDSFLQVRLGLGAQPSRNSVKMPDQNKTLPELWKELQDVAGRYAVVDRVPIVADLRRCGSIGVAGPTVHSFPLAASVVAQFLGLHSPAEVVLTVAATASSATRWNALKWLPHAGSEYSPVPGENLASSPPQVTALVSELEGVIRAREEAERSDDAHPLPVVLVLVEDDAAENRARLVQLAERGPAQGVHLIWVASSLQRIPAACRTYLEVDPNDGVGGVGFVHSGEGVEPVELEPFDGTRLMSFARSLSPVVDAASMPDDQSDLPRNVSLLALAGTEMAERPDEVIAYWRGNNSIPDPTAPRLKRDNDLRALVGQSPSDRYHLDLRTNGPHALVGGTTGAGKSEFLQSWILGMALAHSPTRVNFLFVDYKGGSAFADCVELPHCVGLVTDLTEHMVHRALRSLDAELKRRERILNAKKAKDLLELERRRDIDTPPSLVIVVDEFAALVQDVPEFVDGVINVAQRGRSLGLHLILATQRPAGVIKGNLRANTNLRIALRMADEEDSTDVVGSKIAGTFDPSIPGRGVAKTGPGRLTSFQAAYVGGHTSNEPPPVVVDVHEHPFGQGSFWEEADADHVAPPPTGPTDIRRIVDNIIEANAQAALPGPQKPWLPELMETYRLEELPTKRNDVELVYGVIDRPDEQEQPVLAFVPDRDGNMAVYGTSGAGKSTFLRTIAVAAGFAPARGGPVQVYALDFGSRGLSMLDALPHVGAVINGDDSERTLRLLKKLRSTIDERAERYAAAQAATIVEYRDRAAAPDEPRLLLLVDNFGAFRQMYELGRPGNPFELLESIVADGRAVGVHMVAAADQANAFTTSLKSVIQSHLALRLSSEVDLMLLHVPDEVFTELSPPGRGYLDGCDVQVAVLSGDSNVAQQSAEMSKIAAAMRRAGLAEAPSIERLPDHIPAGQVGQQPGGSPVLGIWDETLEPLNFDPSGIFIVSGPPQSGKSSTVVSMLKSLDAVRTTTSAVLIGPRRSPLVSARSWLRHLSDPSEIAEYAGDLAGRLKQGDPDALSVVVVIENVGELAGGMADESLQSLLRACRTEGAFAIVEGETASFSGSWGLMSVVKLDRTGIVLQPDQADGDMVFNIELPRVRRAEFPPGRGFYTTGGRAYRVQVLAPDVGEGG